MIGTNLCALAFCVTPLVQKEKLAMAGQKTNGKENTNNFKVHFCLYHHVPPHTFQNLRSGGNNFALETRSNRKSEYGKMGLVCS